MLSSLKVMQYTEICPMDKYYNSSTPYCATGSSSFKERKIYEKSKIQISLYIRDLHCWIKRLDTLINFHKCLYKSITLVN